MKVLYAKEYGIVPGQEVAQKLKELLQKLASDDSEKTLVFEKGNYYLDSENVASPLLYITNTIGDNEWKEGEKPHENAVGIYLNGIKNLTVEGNASVFTARGQMTNIAMCGCENVELKNIELRAEKPDMHRLKVVSKGLCSVEFETDDQTQLCVKDDEIFFVGKDYETQLNYKRFTAHWIGKIPAKDDGILFRTSHPMMGALSVKVIDKHRIKAVYALKPRCKVGDSYYLFDVRRKYQGIFATGCKDIRLDGIVQRFNYGLASVFQDCENVTVSNCVFAPCEDSQLKMASVADFMQVCCCRGKVDIKNNFFKGAGDDCLNVHGIHFAVKNADKDNMTVSFMHPQSHGFCPFAKGDKLRLINPQTLLPEGESEVEEAVLTDEYNIRLKLKNAFPVDPQGKVIENATTIPDVTFENNFVDRIITRGLLLTTSGKVVVRKNRFVNTSMNAILVSDDAKNWYESGFVRDIQITENEFIATKGYYVCVKPENSRKEGYVHSGIKITDNYFASPYSKGMYFSCTAKTTVGKNRFVSGKKIKNIKSQIDSDL